MSIIIKIVLLLGLAAVTTPISHVVAPYAHAEGSANKSF